MLSATEDRIITLIAETARLPKDAITPDAQLDDLDIDSLVLVELSFKLRSEFDVPPHIDQELDEVKTIREIFNLVHKARMYNEG